MNRRKSPAKRAEEAPPDMIPHDVVNAIVFFKTQRLPKEKKVRIEVNAVDSPHRFFFNWLGPQYQPVFMDTMDALQFDYRSTNQIYAIPKKFLRMGLACVVKYSNVFFRGAILDVNDDFVEVFTIDYGKKVITLMENYHSEPIFWMRRKFKSMPCQAIPGQLYTIFPKELNWTQESADFLQEQLTDKEVIAEVARYELPGETVSLSIKDPDSGELIELSLVNAGLAEFVGDKGLELIDNEVIPQRIVDSFHAKTRAKEKKIRNTCEAVITSIPVPPGFEPKRRDFAKPVTFDNMLEALETSSVSSYSSVRSCCSQEDKHGLAEGPSPLTKTEELSSVELPTALVRPSMRAESFAVTSLEKTSIGLCEAAEEEDDDIDESASSCASAVERLLSIDASKIVDPMEHTLLRKEIEREMERLRVKMQALDVQMMNSETAVSKIDDCAASTKMRKSNFNPEAAPFVPRSFIAPGASVSAESTGSSISPAMGLEPAEKSSVAETKVEKKSVFEEFSASHASGMHQISRPSFVPDTHPVISATPTNANSFTEASNVRNSLQATNSGSAPVAPAPAPTSIPFSTCYFDQFRPPVAAANLVATSMISGPPKTHFVPNRMSAPTVDLETSPGLGFSGFPSTQISQPSVMVMPPPGFINANPVFVPQFPNYQSSSFYYQRPSQPWS